VSGRPGGRKEVSRGKKTPEKKSLKTSHQSVTKTTIGRKTHQTEREGDRKRVIRKLGRSIIRKITIPTEAGREASMNTPDNGGKAIGARTRETGVSSTAGRKGLGINSNALDRKDQLP